MSYVRSSRLASVDVHVWVGSSVEGRCGCSPASTRRASHDSFRADREADPAIAPDLTAACGVSRENRGVVSTHPHAWASQTPAPNGSKPPNTSPLRPPIADRTHDADRGGGCAAPSTS